MKKSLSLLLAIALVFGMFQAMASAATPTASEAGKQLVDLGILKGDKDGNLLEDSTWNRQDIVVLLSRLLGKEAAAQSTAKSHTYKDVPKGYYDGFLSWAKNEKYAEGYSATKFGFGETLTYKQFAAIVLRALGKDTTGTNYENTAAWAVELKILPEGTNFDAPAKRGDTFVSIVAALNTEVAGTGKTLGEILGLKGFEKTQALTAKQTGAKKIELTFNKAVDTTKYSAEIKRGSSTVVVEKTSWNDAKTVATLELPSKAIDADYVITVKGVTEADLTATVKAQSEKVDGIEILSENAAFTDDNQNKVQVGYKVTNQFGEDITTITSVQANSTGGSVTYGSKVATIEAPAGVKFVLDQKVTLTLINSDPAVVATKVLTVSPMSRVTDVSIEKLYNKDGKTLTTDSTPSDFALVVNAKDQYGQPVNSLTRLGGSTNAEVVVSVTNPAVVSVNGLTGTYATFDTLSVDGTDRTVLKLADDATPGLNAGDSTITLIAANGGKSTKFTVTVATGVKANKITFGEVGQTVAVNETVNLPVVVTDVNGNEITDVSVLNSGHTVNGVTVTGVAGNFIKVDGQVVFSFNSGSVATSISLTGLTATANASVKTISVKAAAEPRVVIGLKAGTKTAVYNTSTLSIDLDKLVVEDQYGRIMSAKGLKDSLNGGTTNGDFRIAVTEANTSGGAISLGGNVLDKNTTSITVNPVTSKSSEGVTFTVEKYNTSATPSAAYQAVSGSAKTVSYRTVEASEITKYSVDAIGKVYSPATTAVTAYQKAVTVTGETADGTKVAVPATNFTVKSKVGGITVVPVVVAGVTTNNTLEAVGVSFASGTNEKDGQVDVIIGATGDVLTADLKVSSAAPTADVVEVKNAITGDVVTSLTISAGSGTFNLTQLLANYTVNVKDQYGVASSAINAALTATYGVGSETGYVVISSVTNGSGGAAPTIANNGTNAATISGLANADSFVFKITIGGKSIELKVNVVA